MWSAERQHCLPLAAFVHDAVDIRKVGWGGEHIGEGGKAVWADDLVEFVLCFGHAFWVQEHGFNKDMQG